MLARRRWYSFAITLNYFQSPFEVLFANMLAKIESTADDFFTKATFVPLLRLV